VVCKLVKPLPVFGEGGSTGLILMWNRTTPEVGQNQFKLTCGLLTYRAAAARP